MAGVKITAVDYKALYETAGKMRNKASGIKGVSGHLDDIYREVGYLATQNNWKGASYDKLATILLDSRTQIQKHLQYLRNAVPRTLEKIANRYSLADTEETLTIGDVMGKVELSTADAVIAKTAPDGSNINLVFNKEAVSQAKQRIDNSFKNALEKLDAIWNDLNSISSQGLWRDDVSSAFCSKFKSNYDNIKSTLDKMQKECDNVIDIAIANMGSVEAANTVV